MIYEFNNKKIKIPDEQIKNNIKILNITEQEAIQMYLEDEGYLENEEVQTLTQKAKENKTDKIVATDKTKPRAKVNREPKQNPDKEFIINQIWQLLSNFEETERVKIENPTKIVTFIYHNKEFKVDLVEKRKKKE